MVWYVRSISPVTKKTKIFIFGLVTGASSGIGRVVTEHILERGDIAVATLRTPSTLAALVEQYPPTQLLVLKCDVTKYDEVKEAFEKAIKAFKRIDIVFNNAGFGFLSEAEGTPEDFARKMFDVNFWAAANISRETVRIFREVNSEDSDGDGPGGRLLNVSSTAGIVSGPCYTYYSARCVSGILVQALILIYQHQLVNMVNQSSASK